MGQFIQFVATFIGAFVISFTKGWLLTVVMLSSIPLVVLSGAMMSLVIAKASSTGQAAYSKSASVVEQTIGSIRTVSTLAKNNIETLFFLLLRNIEMSLIFRMQVASFTGEKQAITKYNQSLIKVYNTSVQEALASGVGFAALFFVFISSYGLAVWYGGKLIIEKGYTGGDVMTVIFAVLTGSM